MANYINENTSIEDRVAQLTPGDKEVYAAMTRLSLNERLDFSAWTYSNMKNLDTKSLKVITGFYLAALHDVINAQQKQIDGLTRKVIGGE